MKSKKIVAVNVSFDYFIKINIALKPPVSCRLCAAADCLEIHKDCSLLHNLNLITLL